IHQAQISTLHSFCLSLIKAHYDEIDIDPNFRTANEVEGIVLLEQAIDDVLESYYEKNEQSFIDLVEHLSNDRSDDQLRTIVKSLYRFSIAHAKPFEWLDSLDEPYYNLNQDHLYFQMMDEMIKRKLNSAKNVLYQSIDCYQNLNAVDAHMTYLEGERVWIDEVIEGTKSLESISNDLKKKKIPMNSSKVKKENEGDEQLLELGKDYHKKYINELNDLNNNYLSRERDYLIQDMQSIAPRVEILAEVTKDIIRYFRKLKQNKRIIDFSDYEHLALDILTNEDGEPSEIALQYREHFEEILVDEYQDTNRVQEAIINCIKTGDESNGNLFMVGEDKQSIYKFRQAEPELFIEKYKRFNSDGNETGKVIDLSKNFRSRREVLDNTNFIFSHMMDEEVGEIEYNDEAKLYYGADYDEQETPLEMDILVEESFKETDNNLIEAKHVVEKVQYILENKSVYDSQTKECYFEQNEVRLMLSFLRVIDNPLQDKYLVGLMRSVAFQFKEDELAEIRNKAPQEVYYLDSIHQYVKHPEADEQLVEKLNQ